MRKDDWRYLEDPTGILLVHLEILDSHETSRVLSIAHVCEPTVVVDPPDADELCFKNIGRWYDSGGLADLRKEE